MRLEAQPDLFSWRPSAPPPAPVRRSVCGEPWPKADTLTMVRLYVESERPDIAAVAKLMGKTYSQVSSQASNIGLSFENLGPNAGLKRCLRCRDDFWSAHKRQIHICPGCKRSLEFLECA